MFQKTRRWRGLAILLAICLLLGAFPVGAVEPTGDTPLYFVDAGGDGTGAPCSLGSYQSTWDRAYGEDTTGKTWGYVGEADKYEGDTYFDSVRVDEQNTPGMGITYKFELEPGFYLVEVGMKEYWQNSGRKTDIRLQGKTVETEIIPYEYENGAIVTAVTALAEGETELTVEIVRSADNGGSNEDPLVSYIRIDRQEGYTSFTGVAGRPFYDTKGKQIQAHGGQIQQLTVDGETKYYWIGEDKTNGYSPVEGVHVYSSTDLYNWIDEGLVLKTMSSVEDIENDDYFEALYGDLTPEERAEIFSSLDRSNSVIERPKMLYNEKTQKYVMWFHADNGSYTKAQAGVAISDSPTGPFQLLGTYDLNYVTGMDQGFDGDSNRLGAVRDMNLFQDDDGTAYIIYSSQGNQTLFISKLNADYTGLATDPASAVRGVDFEIAFAGQSREAPAMFKYNGMYYLVTSGCTGWDPNQAQYAVAETPFGPWTVKGNPCQGEDADVTFSTQSTCVFPVDAEAGKFIYMGDRWNKNDLSESRYVWLPVEFQTGNNMVLKPYSDWTLSELDGKGTVSLVTNLNRCYDSLTALKTSLPNAVTVKFNGQTYENQAVTWSEIPTSIYMGDYTVTGTISGGALDGKSFSKIVTIADSRTVYFFDCCSGSAAYFNQLKGVATQLQNTSPDPAYTEGNAGYTGTVGTDIGEHAGSSILESGWWAESGKNIVYRMDNLAAGTYTVTAGYRDWWAKYTDSRGMRLKVTDENGTVLASGEITLYDDDLFQQVSFTLEAAADVIVTIEKTGGADQVLSLLSLTKTDMLPDPGETDPGELLASFHLISDTHVSTWDGENTKTYIDGMKFMSTLNEDTNIAFVNAGDLTNNGQKSEYNAFFVTTRQYNPGSPEETLILLGNHDVRGSGSWNSDPNGSFPYWETAKALYTDQNKTYMSASAQQTLYHAKKLGGYTFIMLNTEKGLKDAMYMSEAQLAWFEETMKACYEEDPTKPVFIISHQPLNDTHMRSNVLDGFDGINTDGTPNNHYTGSDAKVKEIMAKYPVGVFLSGHIHNGLGFGEAIAREYGVCVDLPSYNSSENGYTEKGAGFEVMIYENQIVFQGYNFATGERLEEYDLVVNSPTVSALYQKATQEVTKTTVYSEAQIQALQNAINTAKPMLNMKYDQSNLAWDDASAPAEFYYHADDWEKLDSAAYLLRQALDGLNLES